MWLPNQQSLFHINATERKTSPKLLLNKSSTFLFRSRKAEPEAMCPIRSVPEIQLKRLPFHQLFLSHMHSSLLSDLRFSREGEGDRIVFIQEGTRAQCSHPENHEEERLKWILLEAWGHEPLVGCIPHFINNWNFLHQVSPSIIDVDSKHRV